MKPSPITQPTPRPSGVVDEILETTSNNYNNSSSSTSWFSGGTLHKSTMREWRQASYSNRLATAADFVAATQDVDFSDLNGFKQMASDLVICISTTGDGDAADTEETAVISAICIVMLFPD